MSDYGDDYDDDYDGDGWLYVEEPDVLADDLAERAVASPPPADVADLDRQYDSDFYDYFVDIEYCSDGFNDAEDRSKAGHALKGKTKATSARKDSLHKPKARKKTTGRGFDHSPTPAVAWRSQQSRSGRPVVRTSQGQDEKPYALFKDWEQRFQCAPGLPLGETSKSATITEHAIMSSKGKAPAREPTRPEIDPNIDPLEMMARMTDWVDNSGIDPEVLLQTLERMLEEDDPGSVDYLTSQFDQTLVQAQVRMQNQGEHPDESAEPRGEQDFDHMAHLLSALKDEAQKAVDDAGQEGSEWEDVSDSGSDLEGAEHDRVTEVIEQSLRDKGQVPTPPSTGTSSRSAQKQKQPQRSGSAAAGPSSEPRRKRKEAPSGATEALAASRRKRLAR